MQLRQHPKIIGRWPPRQSASGMNEPLPVFAVARRVVDCSPSPQPADVQGIYLYTDKGSGFIVTLNATFREHLFQTLHTCLGFSVREIGDVDIDF